MSILLSTGDWSYEPWFEELHAGGDHPVRVHGVHDYDPAAVRYAVTWKPPEGLLRALPNLEVIFNLGAGVDALLEDPDLPDLPIVRLVDDDLTARMTEGITLQVLTHHRQALAYARQQNAREWRELPQPGAAQVRVGMMGYGVLAQDAGEVLGRLGYTLRGWSRSQKQAGGIVMFAGDEGFDAFLAGTDVLVVLLPLTPATRGIVDAGLIAKLPREGALGGPVLINAGRGGLQVEADILNALRSGALHGASLDVFETEPLPADSPLWRMENVIITPHTAWKGPHTEERRLNVILENVRRFVAGEPLLYVADKSLWY